MRDDSFKWFHVPYWQSYGRVDASLARSSAEKWANPLLAMFRSLDSPLQSVRLATVRLDRMFDALQCVEAIRLHAEAHGGALPASLEAMADAPAPLDPATGKPFVYKKEGDTATLSAPIPPGAPFHGSYLIHYIMKPARSKLLSKQGTDENHEKVDHCAGIRQPGKDGF